MLNFSPGVKDTIVPMIQLAGQSNPSWLLPWFNFWVVTVAWSPVFWVSFVGACEVLLGLAIIFGFTRKIAYLLGMLLSLLVWAIPEGFGGPYGPTSTDVGTGIIYALVFLALITINAGYGPSKLSLDHWLEKRIKWWHVLSEFR